MRQPLTAWLTIVAMLAGLALPAHAHASHARIGAADFCTTADAGKAAPARPADDMAGACDACCGCAGGNAPPLADVVSALLSSDGVAVTPAAFDASTAPQVRHSFARGPPPA